MATRRKIPTGAGSHFVVTPRTLRFPVERATGGVVAEVWVNANGDGAIALVPPGGVIPPGGIARQLSPLDALELIRRGNMRRLAAGVPELKIPPGLIRRAKADTRPGIEALVAFPGKLKRFFDGRGSWAGTGLWVSMDLECELEMSAAVGYLRKRLTHREAELWLRANDHEIPWSVTGRNRTPDVDEPEPWRVATRGAPGVGEDTPWVFSWREQIPEPIPAPPGKKRDTDRKLRETLGRVRSLPPPTISPPKKPRRPRRGR